MNQSFIGSGQRLESTVDSTVVCVTDQFNCERLIKVGKRIADLSGTRLFVINVCCKEHDAADSAALQHLFNVSKEYGAEMNIFYDRDPIETIYKFCRQRSGKHIITGVPKEDNSFMNRFKEKMSRQMLYMVDYDGEIKSQEKSM